MGRDDVGVVVVGGGVSGVCAGVRLGQIGVRYVILEKADGIGGAWRSNRYPGSGPDVASHLFAFSFYLNPRWETSHSSRGDFLSYLEEVANFFSVYPNIVFNKTVDHAAWDEETQKWTVTCVDGESYRANFVVSACGMLHIPRLPDVRGLQDFRGVSFHSSEWRCDVDLKDKRVAVVGTGASAVQIVPNIAERARELFVFQRTPCYVVDKVERTYPEWVKRLFSWLPAALLLERWFEFWRMELLFYMLFDTRRKEMGRARRRLLEEEMLARMGRAGVKDPDRLVPKNEELGCKRITLSSNYLETFSKLNVHLVTDRLERLTSGGLRTFSGEEYDVDVIVLATGFNVPDSMRAFKVTGRYSRDLHTDWGEAPAAFNGAMIPNFPNFFRLMGPNTFPGHNSAIYMVECQCNFLVDCIMKVVGGGHHSLDVKTKAMERYMDTVVRTMKHKVFVSGCSSWYQNAKGFVYTMWPSDLTHFWWMTRRCNLAHFNLK